MKHCFIHRADLIFEDSERCRIGLADGRKLNPCDVDEAHVVRGPERQVDIVLQSAHPNWHFVDVESPPGTSIRIGEWVRRDDGFDAIRFTQ